MFRVSLCHIRPAIDQSAMCQTRSDQSGRRDVVLAFAAILLVAHAACKASSFRHPWFSGHMSEYDLSRIKSLGHSLWGMAPNPAESSHREERFVTKPAPPSLAREMPADCFDFASDLVQG